MPNQRMGLDTFGSAPRPSRLITSAVLREPSSARYAAARRRWRSWRRCQVASPTKFRHLTNGQSRVRQAGEDELIYNKEYRAQRHLYRMPGPRTHTTQLALSVVAKDAKRDMRTCCVSQPPVLPARSAIQHRVSSLFTCSPDTGVSRWYYPPFHSYCCSPTAEPSLKMPEVAPYTYDGPIDHTKTIDWAALRGKSVIVTGGANGMGETTVRRFVEAGAFVTFADVDPVRGGTVESELNKDTERSKFVKCDIKSWEEQCTLFETAAANGRGLHVVIANAGISRSSGDSLWNLSGRSGMF